MSSLLASAKEFASCRVKRRACDAGQGSGREAGGGGRACRGGLDCRFGGRAWGGAHVEHVAHVRDAGGVEAQRLVERRRGLPRVERRACGEGRRAGREAGGGGRPRCKQGPGRARLQIRGRARGGAHPEHVAHIRDGGRVEAQRLVEHRRALPRVERRACGAGRGSDREVGGRRATAVHAARRGGLDCSFGAGHGEERTANMAAMFVTLEVSKLSGWSNADTACGESKGGHTVRDDVRAGRRRAVDDRGARSAQERARLQIGGRARGGAHCEHAFHVRDAGGVKAQRLVERRRALPRVEQRACGAARGSGRQTGATASSVQWRLDCRLGTEQAWSAH
eukprot:scaffold65736_cov48-Phaeocystis_antarctica.AAC.2